ncbi:PREDICTED: APO protein 3, mitochondrial [Tarenaya hassleriana]|uniref:APO protein 3, mitochondrial n=1 Tax=Tarenaya hassleriana TaxID=28532 RepID=UPI00053C7690|nr:PREDICTED: APO protein 3, mitochondrial [Tarenaya hassleriana]
MQRSKSLQISQFRHLIFLLSKTHFSSSTKTLTHVKFPPSGDDPLYADVPKPQRDKSERKPYPTPMKELIRRAKEERELRKAQPCRVLEDPPDNGLLVPELVDVAHRVHRARASLLSGLARIVRVITIHRCRFCTEVHVGESGHGIRTCTGPKSGLRAGTHVWKRGRANDVVFFPKCFHLYDRVGRPRVLHGEMFSVPRIPAVLELCIQAGVDIEKFPAKRRTKPVYSIEGRIVDFEDFDGNEEEVNPVSLESHCDDPQETGKTENLGDDIREEEKSVKELSIETMESWFEMVSGVKRIMKKYKVWTCGYCQEVQVGPRGHKVRKCKATKHQMRDGMHAWQEATIDDIIGPNYVWHVPDSGRSVLDNSLKRYYGKAPAVVELCVQGGAAVPDQYKSMMRLDVVPPGRDEVDLVA